MSEETEARAVDEAIAAVEAMKLMERLKIQSDEEITHDLNRVSDVNNDIKDIVEDVYNDNDDDDDDDDMKEVMDEKEIHEDNVNRNEEEIVVNNNRNKDDKHYEDEDNQMTGRISVNSNGVVEEFLKLDSISREGWLKPRDGIDKVGTDSCLPIRKQRRMNEQQDLYNNNSERHSERHRNEGNMTEKGSMSVLTSISAPVTSNSTPMVSSRRRNSSNKLPHSSRVTSLSPLKPTNKNSSVTEKKKNISHHSSSNKHNTTNNSSRRNGKANKANDDKVVTTTYIDYTQRTSFGIPKHRVVLSECNTKNKDGFLIENKPKTNRFIHQRVVFFKTFFLLYIYIFFLCLNSYIFFFKGWVVEDHIQF